MKKLKTKYGVIEEYLSLEMHDSETPASLLFTGPMKVETSCGTLVPQYEVEDHGRQQHKPVLFHKNGTLRRVPLQDSVEVQSRYGTFPAELLLFHKDGTLKKLFPLNGKLSGYWGEKNEYALAQELAMSLPTGEIRAKIISMAFYASGAARSITFWPEERVSISCALGTIETRTGVAFYEDGPIRSLEPAAPTPVDTPIGTLRAFDNDPEGISGDVNSLQFDRAGTLCALRTISDQIVVTTESGEQKIYQPSEKPSLCSDLVKMDLPLLVEFIDGRVRFNNSRRDEYDVAACSFEVNDHVTEAVLPTYECA
jgi:hypothetical protein